MALAALAMAQCVLLFFKHWKPQDVTLRGIDDFVDQWITDWIGTFLPLFIISLVFLAQALERYFHKYEKYCDYYSNHGPLIQMFLLFIWGFIVTCFFLLRQVYYSSTPNENAKLWTVWSLLLVSEFIALWISIWASEMHLHRTFHAFAGTMLALAVLAIWAKSVPLLLLPLSVACGWQAVQSWRVGKTILAITWLMFAFVLAIVGFDADQAMIALFAACFGLIAHEANERLKREAALLPSRDICNGKRAPLDF